MSDKDESLAQQIGKRLRGEIDGAARKLADERRATSGRFEHTIDVDVYYTAPTRTVTATHLDGGSVRLATSCDAIRIENLDDAIEVLCALRQAQDPVGYMAFVDRLIPMTEVIHPVLTVRDLLERLSGTVSAEGRLASVLDDEDIAGKKP